MISMVLLVKQPSVVAKHVASQDAQPAGHENDADAQRRNYGEVNEMKKCSVKERRRL
jgi:hypothetical protein